jgi:hypothetical protein
MISTRTRGVLTAIIQRRTLADFPVSVMQKCYAFDLPGGVYEGNGRGGIRTHGEFPHARFRVECLKPDSATLPIARYCRSYFRMRNCQTAPWRLQRQGITRRRRSIEANRPPGGKKCYNFTLAMPSREAAYCMSQGQPTLLLVVHQDSQVVCAAVHKYSHLIENLNPSPP